MMVYGVKLLLLRKSFVDNAAEINNFITLTVSFKCIETTNVFREMKI